MKPRVVITGGLGFIFSHVSEFLASKGYEVHVLDCLGVGSHPELLTTEAWKDIKFHKQDCANDYTLGIIRNLEPDYIIHAAAISDVDESIKYPARVIRKNNAATINVFEAARSLPNLKKLVYISTDEIYGECETKKKEDEILWSKNPYSLSKAFGSLLRIAYDNSYPELKNKTAETRFCNVFGPRQDERKILGALRSSIKTGEKIRLHNGGTGYREYIYVKNIPPIVEEIMLKGDRVYNVTFNEGFTVRDLVEKVQAVVGKKFATEQGNRPGMDMKYQMDGTRLMQFLPDGWEIQSFSAGILEYFNEK